jgi:hypothetical protein
MVRATHPIRAFSGRIGGIPETADVQSNIVSATLNQSGREADTSMRRSTHKIISASWHERLPCNVTCLTSQLEVRDGSFCPGNIHPIKIRFQEVSMHLDLLPEWYRPRGFDFLTKS